MQVENMQTVTILVSEKKLDFKPISVKRGKEGHYIIIKSLIQQKDLTILNIYTPNCGAFIYKTSNASPIKRLRQPHNNSGGLQHPSDIAKQIIKAENQQKNSVLKSNT